MARADPSKYNDEPANLRYLTVVDAWWTPFFGNFGLTEVQFNKAPSVLNTPIGIFLGTELRRDLVQGSTKFGIPLVRPQYTLVRKGIVGVNNVRSATVWSTGFMDILNFTTWPIWVVVADPVTDGVQQVISPYFQGAPGPRSP